MQFMPNVQDFQALCQKHTHVPVSAWLPADLESPVSAFIKLRPQGACLLLESVERGEHVGRYSFVGVGHRDRWQASRSAVNSETPDPLKELHQRLQSSKVATLPGMPPFLSGAVGFVGYPYIAHLENIEIPEEQEDAFPLCDFLFTRDLLIFDHATRRLGLVALVEPGEGAYEEAQERIQAVAAGLEKPLPSGVNHGVREKGVAACAQVDREHFLRSVLRAQEHIRAGDIFQTVLSRRKSGKTKADPFQVYRALRMLNPSPYMFFLDYGDHQLVGSSPEALVKLDEGVASLRPIAGTRPRGKTIEEDERLEKELAADEKERAEHVMLVDLARNDLGRVCQAGSVRVTELMEVERYSHVMHLVSSVEGRLREDVGMFDLFRASFPAGTVSGAPKVRSMQIISEQEGLCRGPYAGAVGYFGTTGSMDMCIAIRTIFFEGESYHLHSGAGIVYDSIPESEFQEIESKIAALEEAISQAEAGFD